MPEQADEKSDEEVYRERNFKRRARRDLSNGGVYLEAQVPWRAQREIFACAGGAICSQRCQISVPSARAAV